MAAAVLAHRMHLYHDSFFIKTEMAFGLCFSIAAFVVHTVFKYGLKDVNFPASTFTVLMYLLAMFSISTVYPLYKSYTEGTRVEPDFKTVRSGPALRPPSFTSARPLGICSRLFVLSSCPPTPARFGSPLPPVAR